MPRSIVIGNGRVLVNYDAAELPALLGRSAAGKEVIHRDDLVMLRG